MINISEDYIIYDFTKKYIIRNYPEETVKKYGNVIAYLFQNNIKFDTDLTAEEIEETLSFYDNVDEIKESISSFQKEANAKTLKKTKTPKSEDVIPDDLYGKKIIDESVKSFLFNTSFIVSVETISGIKTTVESNGSTMLEELEKLETLFNSQDKIIDLYLKTIDDIEEIRNYIFECLCKYDENKKVLFFKKFSTLRAMLYSFYIKDTDQAGATNNSVRIDNINDELYGSSGRYNPNDGSFKNTSGRDILQTGCLVQDIKIINNMDLTQALAIKKLTNIISNGGNLSKGILQDIKDVESTEDEKYFNLLNDFIKGKRVNIEDVRKVVVNVLLNGVLTILCLKHNITFLKQNNNSERADRINKEFKDIIKYCNIDKEILL